MTNDKTAAGSNEDNGKQGGARRSGHTDEQRQPQPGTEGPDGHLDDQPQREDEYLSGILNEFNPQRKDKQKPVDTPDSSKVIRSDDVNDTKDDA